MGRISEIELYYSQSTFLKDNEYILMKIIEGNFLRNRHTEACKILDTKANKAPTIFGKIIIICDILNVKVWQRVAPYYCYRHDDHEDAFEAGRQGLL